MELRNVSVPQRSFLLGCMRKKTPQCFISFVWGEFAVYPGKDFRKVMLKID